MTKRKIRKRAASLKIKTKDSCFLNAGKQTLLSKQATEAPRMTPNSIIFKVPQIIDT